LPKDARLIARDWRLWPQKRVKDIIWAADLVQCVRDDVHIPDYRDGPQRWRLEKYAEQVTVAERVRFSANEVTCLVSLRLLDYSCSQQLRGTV